MAQQSRDWHTWPFTPTSPWNTPVGSQVTSVPITAPGWSYKGAILNVFNATVNIVTAAQGDPVWNLYDNTNFNFGNYPPPPDPNYNNSVWYANHTHSGFNQSTFCNPITNNDSTQFLSTSVYPDPTNINSFPFRTNPWSVVTGNVNAVNHDYYMQMQMPSGTCGSPDTDGLLSVIQPTTYGTLAVDLYAPIPIPTPPTQNGAQSIVISQGIGTYYDLKNGDGTGSWNGRRASLIPTIAGVVRKGEQAVPTIPHALAVIMSQTFMQNAAVWPAAGYDTSNSYACHTSMTNNCLSMGSLLIIPSSVSISAIGIKTALGLAFARAAQTYGVYIVDTARDTQGQASGIAFLAELNDNDPGIQNDPDGYADLQTIIAQLQLVTNNSPTNPGGPGTHSPMAPPFSN